MAIQFPVYQIDFSAVAAGKRVAATKRRIRWYVSVSQCLKVKYIETIHCCGDATVIPSVFIASNLTPFYLFLCELYKFIFALLQ